MLLIFYIRQITFYIILFYIYFTLYLQQLVLFIFIYLTFYNIISIFSETFYGLILSIIVSLGIHAFTSRNHRYETHTSALTSSPLSAGSRLLLEALSPIWPPVESFQLQFESQSQS